MDAPLQRLCDAECQRFSPASPRRYWGDLLVIANGFDMNAAAVVGQSVKARDQGFWITTAAKGD
jgi:hypothetical protein